MNAHKEKATTDKQKEHTSRMIVVYEKHEPRYLEAATPEAWPASALALLTRRDKDGYWDRPSQDEWEELCKDDVDDTAKMSNKEIMELPFDLRKGAREERAEARVCIKDFYTYKQWYEAMRQVVDSQDTSFKTINSKHSKQRVPKAWVVLCGRINNEYEGIELVEPDYLP